MQLLDTFWNHNFQNLFVPSSADTEEEPSIDEGLMLLHSSNEPGI